MILTSSLHLNRIRLSESLGIRLATLLLLSSTFLVPALADNNDTNGTYTAARVGWVSSSNYRSTYDILWGCFTTFLVCSWKCVHLNIPSVEESEAGWHWPGGWLPCPTTLLLKKWLRKFKWTLLIALAPEIGVGIAAQQYIEARNLHKEFQHLNFTITHAFYALMGGFAIAIPHIANNGNAENNDKRERSNSTIITTKGDSILTTIPSTDTSSIYNLTPKDFSKLFCV
jgi:hypothetical protein